MGTIFIMKYMNVAYCGRCGSEMIQAAETNRIYHLCPDCGNSFMIIVDEKDCLVDIPSIMSPEDVRIVSQIDIFLNKE